MTIAPGLLALGRLLTEIGYEFTTVTPATHRLLNARTGSELARSVRDVFGWSRPFSPEILPRRVFEATCAARACERVAGTRLWRPLVRFSSLEGKLFAHSAFPTTATDSVFFGPDSYRFVRAIEQSGLRAARVVDVGCGSGVGAIALAARGLASSIVLADINPEALRFAELNACLSGVSAEAVQSDVLYGVRGEFDLVISNPPYLRDDQHRVYRDGGGSFGERLAARIVSESLSRLRQMPNGGSLLLYTGAAIVDGKDTFMNAVRAELERPFLSFEYQELDPDVFSDELERPAYAEVERIAAVFLKVRIDGSPTGEQR